VRPQLPLRARSLVLGLGALSLVTYLAASAPGAAGADSQGAPIRISLSKPHARYQGLVRITGRFAGGGAGRRLVAELRSPGSNWAPVGRAVTAEGGAFRFAVRLRRSGRLRVRVDDPQAQAAGAGTAAQEPDQSNAVRVAVAAVLAPRVRRLDVLGGRRALVTGFLRPGARGRVVAVQGRIRGRWHTIARTRTAASGRFRLRFRGRRAGSVPVRLRFAGDRANERAIRPLGRLNVYRAASASWYGPGLYGGHLACGGRLGPGTLGVAHRTLPCGTRVTLRHRRRTVRVRVIDRGPFVAGREFDLTAATKYALGFGSTGTVWVAH
jgi:rare lipoprotein A